MKVGKVVRLGVGFILTFIVAVVITFIICEDHYTPRIEIEKEKEIESPWGIPDYDLAPRYEKAPREVEEKFVEAVPETVHNYHPDFNAHYGQEAKQICTTLDNSGLKYGDVFPPEDTQRFAYIAVSTYCPHNL